MLDPVPHVPVPRPRPTRLVLDSGFAYSLRKSPQDLLSGTSRLYQVVSQPRCNEGAAYTEISDLSFLRCSSPQELGGEEKNQVNTIG